MYFKMNEIEVKVESTLPDVEPQARYTIKISKNATVEDLLKHMYNESHVPVKRDWHTVTQEKYLLKKGNMVYGSAQHWTGEGGDDKKSCKCNTFFFLAILSFLIGAAGITAICLVRFQRLESITDYAIVFDAGSTHTSMFVYEWNGAKNKGTAVARQIGEKCDAKGRGISSFESNPSEAGDSIMDCLKEAETLIPIDKYSNTPVYLGATADMRLIQLRNPDAAEAILESVRDTFSVSKFKVINPKTSVRIISSADEGIFSWVTSNYLANVFNVEKPWVKGPVTRFQDSSIGAIDLGGASAQITFVPEKGTVIPKGYSHKVKLYGEDYDVYTHSFLCYGAGEMLNTILAELIKAARSSARVIEHVCLPKGYTVTESTSKIFASPCVSGFMRDRNVTFKGVGDQKRCTALLSDTLFNKTLCPYSQCSMNGGYRPPITGPFFVPLSKAENKRNGMDFYSWAQYVSLLLRNNFNFTEDHWNLIDFVSEVSGSEVGWTLGFILNESYSYEVHKNSPKISTLSFSLLMVLFVTFIAASIGMTWIAYEINLFGGFTYMKMSS
ncbi:hypothetical protein EGW08_020210 [Elysia chlorotica]|uniref:Ectonucleoside triphosphate diphosphohydrolase 1 n=1 Tax=Elysia chlorotica TaxID=188477 RepID=A0A3S1B4X0_ELYCH|nr:hypothetical protein EGW08_020210 [Elysia chlorotica]